MFKSLYSRLALVLLGVFLAMALLFLFLFNQASTATQNEASQRLHLKLAENIVKDLGITSKGGFDTKMIKDAFHRMMILGPTIELYVLDKSGKLVAYDAPEEKIKRRNVDLNPVVKFVKRKQELPILGDDPRSEDKQKIFSAARVYAKEESDKGNNDAMGTFVGYLYIIIGGENYDNVATALRLSKTWKISLIGIASALVFLLLASLLLFYALTRPLRKLTREIKAFEASDFKQVSKNNSDQPSGGQGELNVLKQSFHQMEQRIADLLERLNKQNEIRRDFLAYVSHDLRTPLSGMKAYLETLEIKQDSLPLSERKEFLQKAITNGDRLEGMINELFELTRLESQQVELNKDEFPIGDLLSDIYSSLEKKANDKQVNLEIECAEPQAEVSADIAKIERVIQNLVENAIRYSEKGGTVTLSAKKITDKSNYGKIKIQIKDSGAGIAANHLPHIFEPYYRASDEYKLKHKGAGLGLAISQRLLVLHDIQLEVDSEIGKGTVFSFALLFKAP